MLWTRLLYGFTLLGALVFHICNTSYIVYFFWLLTLALPFLSLLLSLPSMLSCRITVRPTAHSVQRNAEVYWEVKGESRFQLPLSRVTFTLCRHNALTGKTSAERIRFGGKSSEVLVKRQADTEHCGHLTCTAQHVRICDCLGLFAIRRPPAEGCLTVLPIPLAEALLPGMEENAGQGNTLRARPDGGPGEDYDLRAYRPGDPVRAVHWKLSSKRDELIIKEMLEVHHSPLLLTFEHFGTAEEMDRVLDRLDGLCRSLLDKQRCCTVRWVHPHSGQLRSFSVSNERERQLFLTAALADPAPVEGCSVLETAFFSQDIDSTARHFHIGAEKEIGVCKQTSEIPQHDLP